jgi:hypothetical protein
VGKQISGTQAVRDVMEKMDRLRFLGLSYLGTPGKWEYGTGLYLFGSDVDGENFAERDIDSISAPNPERMMSMV